MHVNVECVCVCVHMRIHACGVCVCIIVDQLCDCCSQASPSSASTSSASSVSCAWSNSSAEGRAFGPFCGPSSSLSRYILARTYSEVLDRGLGAHMFLFTCCLLSFFFSFFFFCVVVVVKKRKLIAETFSFSFVQILETEK